MLTDRGDGRIVPHQDPGGAAEAEPGIGEMLGRLHLMMRGRYLLCIVLAVILSVGFAYGGYRLGEQTYRAMGQLRVVPTLPRVMFDTDDKGVMPMFDSFVQTQVGLIKTQRVIELAMDDRGWNPPLIKDDAAIASFTKRLNVARDNELIYITFEDPNPATAQQGVKAVIAAYRRLYLEADKRENERILEELTLRQRSLSGELQGNQSRIRAIAERHGSDQLEPFFTAALAQVQKLELALTDLKLQQAILAKRATSPSGVSEEALARDDGVLADLIKNRLAAMTRVRTLRATLGDTHPSVKAAEAELKVASDMVQERIDGVTSGSGATTQPSDPLAEQIGLVTENLNAARSQLKTIGDEQFQLTDLRIAAASLNERLDQTKKRIEELTTEAPVSTGRISVISEGDRPLAPSKDTRRTFAAAAGFVGAVLPFGLTLLIAASSRKYKAPSEARISSITRDLVLGALPHVDEESFDPEDSELAAHCMHQVRAMLQIRCNGHAKAIAVTSSRAGSGKTSVVLGLGVSYAMAGSRTILIDLDLVGGGLTRRAELHARKRLGELLIAQGMVTPEQLQQALATATADGSRVGEAFVKLGFLTEAQLAELLAEQKRSHAGLMEVLYGEPLQNCVASAGMKDLDILPLGSANAHDAATLSPAEIKDVIDEAKTMYDTVLVDTGPVPGSLEASIVAAITDGVVLVVARGEHRAAADASITHLRRVGGRVAGLIFNRARASDAGMISGSLYHSGRSTRSTSSGSDRKPSATRQPTSERFGPVGQAVVDLAPPPASTPNS